MQAGSQTIYQCFGNEDLCLYSSEVVSISKFNENTDKTINSQEQVTNPQWSGGGGAAQVPLVRRIITQQGRTESAVRSQIAGKKIIPQCNLCIMKHAFPLSSAFDVIKWMWVFEGSEARQTIGNQA